MPASTCLTTRRDLLKYGALLSTWAGAAQAMPAGMSLATAPLPAGIYKVLGDRRHTASIAFVAAAQQQGLDGLLLPTGDISAFWREELQSRWQEAPVAVAGLTDAGPLFCLQQLGAQYGLRVLQQEPVAMAQGEPLLAWLIAPVTA